PHGEGRRELNSPAGAVQTPNGEASGLDPEVLHTSTMVELSRWHSLFIAQGYLTTNILRRS
ncbi:hypothetical protein, partial [Haloquadratum walsbyi]|uniref:hypothetical protein n=1 Tax=Haloquadratum walsbyi TaxID=293091 RepID=UPI001AD8DF2A